LGPAVESGPEVKVRAKNGTSQKLRYGTIEKVRKILADDDPGQWFSTSHVSWPLLETLNTMVYYTLNFLCLCAVGGGGGGAMTPG